MLAKSSIRAVAVAALIGTGISGFGAAYAQQPEESAREAADRDLQDAQRRDTRQYDYRGGAIPFEQILSSPGDIDLNVAYARQQIAAGDLKEGSASLERILLIDPSAHDVRVLYGLVLYRLGLFDRARYELELALESNKLPPALRAEAETYLGRIKYEQRATRASLTLTTGFEYDSNRNQAPSSGQALSFDFPFNAAPKQDDLAWVISASGRILHDLGSQEGHVLFLDAGFYHSDKLEVDRLDLNAASLALGATFYAGNWSFTPAVRGGMYWLGGEDYLRTLGGELEVAYRWNPKFTTFVAARAEDEDFRATVLYPDAHLRSGRRISGRAGAIWRINPTNKLLVEGLYSDKKGSANCMPIFDIDSGCESYDRYGGYVQLKSLLGRGAFSTLSLRAENSNYDGVDNFISSTIVRDEWIYRGRAAIGAPMSFFFPGAPEAVKDLNIIAQYEYESSDSNLLNYDFKSHKVGVMLSKRFAF